MKQPIGQPMADTSGVEHFVAIYGEAYRQTIAAALRWVDDQEAGMRAAGMGLRVPIGRSVFIRDVVRGSKKGP